MPRFFQLPRRFRPSEFSRFPPCVLSPFSAILSRSDFRPVNLYLQPSSDAHRAVLVKLLAYCAAVPSSAFRAAAVPPEDPTVPVRCPIVLPSVFLICVLSLFFCDLSRSALHPITCSPSAFRTLQGPFSSKYGHILCAIHVLLSHSHKRRPPRIYPDGLPRYSSASVSSGSACTYLLRACAGSPLSIGLFGVSTTSVLSDN